MANIIIFGDSIAYGAYDAKGGWGARLKRYCSKKNVLEKPAKETYLFNQASPWGDTSIEVLSKLKREAEPRIWSNRKIIIIFAFGVNDSILINRKKPRVSEKVFKKNLNEIVSYSKKYADKIIFLSPLPIEEKKVTPMPWSPTEYYFNDRIRKYREILKHLCRKEKLYYLDLTKYFNDNIEKLLHDGVHPNTEGHKKIFEIVKNFLVKNKII